MTTLPDNPNDPDNSTLDDALHRRLHDTGELLAIPVDRSVGEVETVAARRSKRTRLAGGGAALAIGAAALLGVANMISSEKPDSTDVAGAEMTATAGFPPSAVAESPQDAETGTHESAETLPFTFTRVELPDGPERAIQATNLVVSDSDGASVVVASEKAECASSGATVWASWDGGLTWGVPDISVPTSQCARHSLADNFTSPVLRTEPNVVETVEIHSATPSEDPAAATGEDLAVELPFAAQPVELAVVDGTQVVAADTTAHQVAPEAGVDARFEHAGFTVEYHLDGEGVSYSIIDAAGATVFDTTIGIDQLAAATAPPNIATTADTTEFLTDDGTLIVSVPNELLDTAIAEAAMEGGPRADMLFVQLDDGTWLGKNADELFGEFTEVVQVEAFGDRVLVITETRAATDDNSSSVRRDLWLGTIAD
ncbi:MAG: hypothetical protein GY708_00680 [Actinomycetia bacterium]|nr:hypothetical protein [Actinomycetes bacterium]MCP4959653.1 hypothetical protein [Actinomycetes bacterium]